MSGTFVRIFATSLLLAAGSLPADAAVRTFVSGKGSDTGACTLAAPCRSFAYAVTQTSPSGELDVLDTAGYGEVTITQAITINNPAGSLASVAVQAGHDGITINAGANDTVILRGLTVEGSGIGQNGIVFNSGGGLSVDNCIIENFIGTEPNGTGILIRPTSGTQRVTITHTTLLNNSNVGLYHLASATGTAITRIVVDELLSDRNHFGVAVSNLSGTPTYLSVTRSRFVNGSIGLQFYCESNQLYASLEDSVLTGNATGINALKLSTLTMGRNVITQNSTGMTVTTAGATATSYSNNHIRDNGLNIGGTLTKVPGD